MHPHAACFDKLFVEMMSSAHEFLSADRTSREGLRHCERSEAIQERFRGDSGEIPLNSRNTAVDF
jgi:hypothetical protein